MTEIEFNPGHLEAIQGFLNTDKQGFSPEYLAEQATTKDLVEKILFVLQQELGNTAMPAQFFEYLVEDIDVAAAQVTEENVEKLTDMLTSYQEIIRKATVNAHLIIDCLARIQKIEQVAQESGQESMITEKSVDYIKMLVRDNALITQAFAGKLEAYNRSYENGVAKLNEYLDQEN